MSRPSPHGPESPAARAYRRLCKDAAAVNRECDWWLRANHLLAGKGFCSREGGRLMQRRQVLERLRANEAREDIDQESEGLGYE